MLIERKSYMFEIWEEWSQFYRLRNFNWSNFHLFNMEFEYDRYCGQLEFTMIIFGFGSRIAFNIETDKSTETYENFKKEIQTIQCLSTIGWTCFKDSHMIKSNFLHIFPTRKEARTHSKKFHLGKVEKVYMYKRSK